MYVLGVHGLFAPVTSIMKHVHPIFFALAAGCHRVTEASTTVEPIWSASVASADVINSQCYDVGETRACWKSNGEVVQVARPTPTRTDAWRCVGSHGERKCRRRLGSSGKFVCDAGLCVQSHLRLPNDGEWECFERYGAVICQGGTPAAGVVSTRDDEAWICGSPRAAPNSPRICIDLSPDRPVDPAMQCTIQERATGATQHCRNKSEPALGRACTAASDCPQGAACAGGACVPKALPTGECWHDSDCASGSSCVFATCIVGR
jgi:hypothetical protein